MNFNGKDQRLQHIVDKKEQASSATQPEFMAFTNKPTLPSQENRAIDNYRVNFYGEVVKRR